MAYAAYMNEGFKCPDHIVDICKNLDEFVFGDLKRLIISIPPRHGKSFLCSQALPQFILGNFPSKKILTATYSQSLSNTFSREVIRGMKTPQYKNLFPDTVIITDNDTGSFVTSLGGHYVSTSRGGTITGLGGDYIILDDLIKNSLESRSPTLHKNMRDWYDSTMYSRLLPGGKILFLMTRWSKDDLIQYILDNDDLSEWKYINYPALDEKGNALWEEMFSSSYLLDIKRRNPRQFECLYQGNPYNEELTKTFNLSQYKFSDINSNQNKQFLFIFSSWDTASKVDPKHCYSVGTKWGVTVKGELYLLDYIKIKLLIPDLRTLILSKHQEWDCKVSLIEDANSGTAIIQELSKKIKIDPISPNVKKKIPDACLLLEEHKVILLDFPEITKELEEYPHGEFSDCVASVVNAIWWYSRKNNTHHNFSIIKSPRLSRFEKLV